LDTLKDKICDVVKKLPKSFGGGGESGVISFEKLDKEAKSLIQARLKAKKIISQHFDDFVDSCLLSDNTLIDNMFNDNDNSIFKKSNMTMKMFGDTKLILCGALIQKFENYCFNK